MINLSVIKNISRIKKCARGTIISGAGIGPVLFIVLKGDIGVYTNYRLPGSALTATVSTGGMFADPGLLRNKKAAYTTVSLTDAIILPVDKRGALDFIRDEPAVVLEILKELSAKLDYAAAPGEHPTAENKEKKPLAKKPSDSTGVPETPDQPPVEKAVAAPAAEENAAAETAAGGAGKAQQSVRESRFPLFPEEHGRYHLKLKDPSSELLMNKWFTCPICCSNFTSTVVRPSKLYVKATDADLRCHYKDIEPLYYEVLTCPHCLYSALPDVFESPDKPRLEIQRELARLKDGVGIAFNSDKTADMVFAGFYLALFCAPVSFLNHQLLMGRLLYKLSRVYSDAGDNNLENATAKNALDYFLEAYSSVAMQQSQEQQVCVTIAELYLKQGDLRNAIAFFSKAKAMGGSQVLKDHAGNRIHDIRILASQQRG